MGILVPTVPIVRGARVCISRVSMEEVLRHYQLGFFEKTDGSVLYCRCPLPEHPRDNRGNTLRVYGYTAGVWRRWTCLSKTCTNGKPTPGDVLSFVARKENCGDAEALKLLITWFPEQFRESESMAAQAS